jgi:cytochrome c biogenesis protein CcmG/thiol:disulfide interchange protein DsbE
MKLTELLATFVVSISLLLVGKHAAYAQEVGSIAPSFQLGNAEENINLQKYQGKVIYLDFWASWCAPCKQSFPWLNEMNAKYKKEGLQIIAINLDVKSEDVDIFLKAVPAAFKVVTDPKATTAKLYAIKGMPSSVLIGRDGKIVMHHSGFRMDDKSNLEKNIQLALKK